MSRYLGYLTAPATKLWNWLSDEGANPKKAALIGVSLAAAVLGTVYLSRRSKTSAIVSAASIATAGFSLVAEAARAGTETTNFFGTVAKNTLPILGTLITTAGSAIHRTFTSLNSLFNPGAERSEPPIAQERPSLEQLLPLSFRPAAERLELSVVQEESDDLDELWNEAVRIRANEPCPEGQGLVGFDRVSNSAQEFGCEQPGPKGPGFTRPDEELETTNKNTRIEEETTADNISIPPSSPRANQVYMPTLSKDTLEAKKQAAEFEEFYGDDQRVQRPIRRRLVHLGAHLRLPKLPLTSHL